MLRSKDWQKAQPSTADQGAGLQTASKAEQERGRPNLNRLAEGSLLHINYTANLLHVGKEDLSGPSSNLCPSPSATHGRAAEGIKADVTSTLRVIPGPEKHQDTQCFDGSSVPSCASPTPCHFTFGSWKASALAPNQTDLGAVPSYVYTSEPRAAEVRLKMGVLCFPRCGRWALLGRGGRQGQEKNQQPVGNGGWTSLRGRALQKCAIS